MQLRSWIDNVIVPILVQEILEERRMETGRIDNPAPMHLFYARYSSDRQREASIVDQQRNMMRYAEARDWRIDPDLMFSDEAISGAGLDRPGFQALLRAAKATPRCVDVVLVDDTSRLSRSLADSVRLREELNFRGIRFVAVSQNIDSNNDESDVLMTVHGLVDCRLYKGNLRRRPIAVSKALRSPVFIPAGAASGTYQRKSETKPVCASMKKRPRLSAGSSRCPPPAAP